MIWAGIPTVVFQQNTSVVGVIERWKSALTREIVLNKSVFGLDEQGADEGNSVQSR